MFGYKRYVVAQNERALVFRDGIFERVLAPGVYREFDPLGRLDIQTCDLSVVEFRHPKLDSLLEENAELIGTVFDVYEIGDFQVGLVYRNDRLADILKPGTRTVYWRGPVKVRVEVLDITEDFELRKTEARQLARARDPVLVAAVRDAVYSAEVADRWVGLLFVDGELLRTLKPGLYAYWRFNRSIKVELVEGRWQAMEVAGQEILTKDKVSLRVNLTAQYRVADPVKARMETSDFNDYLYRRLQFALRQAVGARTLDALLANKGELDRVLFESVVNDVEPIGLVVSAVGVKDVILPGDMKLILNQVVEAQKAAEANVIKRREETAATRSLLNTAKLMADNPTLMRLKELETLEKVTEKVEKLTVFGGLEGVLQDTVRLNVRAD